MRDAKECTPLPSNVFPVTPRRVGAMAVNFFKKRFDFDNKR